MALELALLEDARACIPRLSFIFSAIFPLSVHHLCIPYPSSVLAYDYQFSLPYFISPITSTRPCCTYMLVSMFLYANLALFTSFIMCAKTDLAGRCRCLKFGPTDSAFYSLSSHFHLDHAARSLLLPLSGCNPSIHSHGSANERPTAERFHGWSFQPVTNGHD